MAQVAQDPQLRDRIDHFLTYLAQTWASIPALAAEWDEWDEHSRFVFTIDWPVCEDRLHQLQQWAEQGVLTPEQHARYDALMTLAAEHRPVLGRTSSRSLR